MLKVGKIYRHSNPESDTRWKIVRAWNTNMFEGRAVYDMTGNTSHTGKSVMFDMNGWPIGAQDTENYRPNGWHIVEETTFEVLLLYSDGTTSGNWEKLGRASVWTPGTQYVVREKGKLETVSLMTHEEIICFMQHEKIDI